MTDNKDKKFNLLYHALENITPDLLTDIINNNENNIEYKIDNILSSSDRNIDGVVLGTAMQLVFRCGLMKKEIPVACIRNIIVDQHGIPLSINITPNRPISLPDDEAKNIILSFLVYLENNYGIDPDDPLFPDYGYERILTRHLDKFSLDINETIKNGVIRYYIICFLNNDSETSIKMVAIQFREQTRTIKKILRDNGLLPTKIKYVKTKSDIAMDKEVRMIVWEQAKQYIRHLIRIGHSFEDAVEKAKIYNKKLKK